MKKYILLSILLVSIITQKSNAQATDAAAGNPYMATYYLGFSTGNDVPFATAGTAQMKLHTSGSLDILGTAQGYQIGGNMVLWHEGITSSIYVGVGAGQNSAPGSTSCTFVGNDAGQANVIDGNTGIGYGALAANTYAIDNTAVGAGALATQAYTNSNTRYSSNNTAVGRDALHNNNPIVYPNGTDNTAIGQQSMYYNQTGSTNTAVGQQSLYSNTSGGSNTALGLQTMHSNTTGNNNVGIGMWNLYSNTTGINNTSLGTNAMKNSTGSYNSSVGYDALINNSGNTGSYNSTLGMQTDVTGSGLKFATAIGAEAKVAASYQMELGHDSVTVTIGSSGSSNLAPTSPVTKLEIRTDNDGSAPFNITATTSNPYTGCGTGWSGLRFDDLTTASTPCTNPGTGVLALNSKGDVIYVTSPTGGTGIGYCPTLTAMTGSGGYDMGTNSKDFYFSGQNSNLGLTDVAIGNTCTYTPVAKLDVYQNSTTAASIGTYIRNDDAPNYNNPSIGIKSYMLPYTNCYQYKVAGWFEADGSSLCVDPYVGQTVLTNVGNYAIFIPNGGGTEDIGFKYPLDEPDFLLDVNGYGRTLAGIIPSDTILKRNVNAFTYGLKAIRQLKTYSYQYNGKGGFDTTYTYIGFIAQNLKRTIPSAVVYSSIIKDTLAAGDTENIGNVYEEAVVCAAVNAIKEVDSVNTTQQNTIDSLRTELTNLTTSYDSVRSVFLSYLSCIKSLCSSGVRGPQNGRGDGTSDNNTDPALNTQDITLSASTGAPLLYQNMPNPFGTGGTKINYYLPDGTMGATIVFYDTYGNMLKTVQLSQTGNGTLNITPDNLSNGIYSYSLIVNGSIIDTKKMLLQK